MTARGEPEGLEPVVVHVMGSDDALTLSADSGEGFAFTFTRAVEIIGLYVGETDLLARRQLLPRGGRVRLTFAPRRRLLGGPWSRVAPPACLVTDEPPPVRWECACGWRTWTYPEEMEPDACARCMGLEPTK